MCIQEGTDWDIEIQKIFIPVTCGIYNVHRHNTRESYIELYSSRPSDAYMFR